MSLIITKNVYLMEEIVNTLLGHGLDRDKDQFGLEKNRRVLNNVEIIFCKLAIIFMYFRQNAKILQ